MLRKKIAHLRDTFIAGIIFLLPLLIFFVLVTKVFSFLTGFATRIASLFGLKSIAGISGETIAGSAALLIIIIGCGYLVRFAFFKQMNAWLDNKLVTHFPGYRAYKELAVSKLYEQKNLSSTVECPALYKKSEILIPCFVIKEMKNGLATIFLPGSKNSEDGNVALVPISNLTLLPHITSDQWKIGISNKGLGIEELILDKTGDSLSITGQYTKV
ncbi:MAG: hypothetical protein QM768_16900 [Agriterribacter sp.]